jgi:hypothetical protein
VYRVNGTPETPEGRLWAAVLWAGDGAALSRRTAAWFFWKLDGLGRRAPDAIDLTVPEDWHLKAPAGVVVHRAWTLKPGLDHTLVRGLPCTTVQRTLIDLAGELEPIALEQALDSAARKDRGVLERTRVRLEELGTKGRAGADVLAKLLAHPPLSPSGSALEVLVRRALEDAGLPPPIAQLSIEDRHHDQAGIADFAWPEHGVVLEVHGHEFHSTDRAHERDFRRHAAMAAVGLRVIPVTTKRFMEDRDGVIAEVREALDRN